MLQQRRGLRPSEMLGLTPEDVCFSDSGAGSGPGRADIALGARVGTKLKHPQWISVYADCDPDVLLFLRWVVQHTPKGKLLFPRSIDTFRNLMVKVSEGLGIRLHWTPIRRGRDLPRRQQRREYHLMKSATSCDIQLTNLLGPILTSLVRNLSW